jgi:hypothetical protein
MLRRGIIIREYDEVVRQKDEDVKDETKEEITEETKEEILDSPVEQNDVPEVQTSGEKESGEKHRDTVEQQEDTKNESKEHIPDQSTSTKIVPDETPQ